MEYNVDLLEYTQSCPYCAVEFSLSDLQEHLDWCQPFESLIRTFTHSRVHSSRRSSSDIQTTSEEELPSTIIHLEKSQSSSSSPPRTKRSVISCPVCFIEYNSSANTPLVLPFCGHTVCENCLHSIVEHTTVIKCPACRTLNFKDVASLPINYALLEATEVRDTREFCPVHSLEIVGYCATDAVLLCGACVFEHKDHDSFLLTDEKAIQVSKTQQKILIHRTESLEKEKRKWEKTVKGLNRNLEELKETADIHVESLKYAEKQLIKEVKQGRKSCVSQVLGDVANREVKELHEQIGTKMKNIESMLSEIREKHSCFDELYIVKKLTCFEIPTENPPKLETIEKLSKKIKIPIKHEDSINKKEIVYLGISQ